MSSRVSAAFSIASRPQPRRTRAAEICACGCFPASSRARWNGSWYFTSSTPSTLPSAALTCAAGPSTRSRSRSPPVTVDDRCSMLSCATILP